MFQTNMKVGNGQYQINGLPDNCPFCHRSIIPQILSGFMGRTSLQLFMNCPKDECSKAFIAYYKSSGGTYYFNKETTIGTLISRSFSIAIKEISKSFVEIYNQAYVAEQYNLIEICGVGYRKSLEFLIKDYSVMRNPEEEVKIKKMTLSKCITEYVQDSRIKSVSKRAIWLGNDETHYERKWEGKSLLDLKNLIDLTVHWIEMEKLTDAFENDMPEPK